MILCITEKPSVARDIAKILHAETKRDGYYEGGDYCITWTFGHLCTLKEPADYTDLWKRWSLGQLPMIPERFGIKLINDKGIERQFATIEHLAARASEIINCGDAGQEGELIQRWVMQKAGVKCPVKRLWISSLTDESIRTGFRSLRPQADFDNLYYAGLSRAIGDWLLGLNATRLYTLKYSDRSTLSIGRVQTPTLALIVRRHHEIANFKPEDFFEIKTIYRDTTFNATQGRFGSEAEAQAIVDRIAPLPLRIISSTEKSGREAPPRLFDLTSLQVECNRLWGMTADETLRHIQSLYEKKVTTYPRVDTTYLSEDIYPKVPDILSKMAPYASLTAPLLSNLPLPKSKKVFDNAKVTDHHAIIPTGESPSGLVGDERKLYHLIAQRFIAAFYPDCQFNTTTVLAEAGDVEFKATGKVIVTQGWREILGNNGSGADSEQILPQFETGESGPHNPQIQKKTTQPPKYYTEGTLLRAMESAGRTIDDEELREAMKENGIGRPSTRSAIIETLFRRNYIYRSKKNIMAAQAGIDLIATIREELLKSARLTGIWENKLRCIERGSLTAQQFIDDLKVQLNEIVRSVLADNSNRRIEAVIEVKPAKAGAAKGSETPKKPRRKPVKSFDEIVCPSCGKGHIVKGNRAFGCSEYAGGCHVLFPFADYPSDLTPAKLAAMLRKLKKE